LPLASVVALLASATPYSFWASAKVGSRSTAFFKVLMAASF
jgi:hypothetical protein